MTGQGQTSIIHSGRRQWDTQVTVGAARDAVVATTAAAEDVGSFREHGRRGLDELTGGGCGHAVTEGVRRNRQRTPQGFWPGDFHVGGSKLRHGQAT